MSTKNKGFTLVELIVVLVILAILAALLIPALTGYIDRANEKRLIAACRSCVMAAQTIASEDYGLHGTTTPPDATEVQQLAEVSGRVNGVSLEDGATIASLTYWQDEEYVSYISRPYPHYVFDAAVEVVNDHVWAWADGHTPSGNNNEWLTIDYSKQQPKPLTQQQLTAIFGDLQPAKETQYIYPMAIYDNDNNLLNIQYVTPQDPDKTGSQNRYQATAFLIDGKTYISTASEGDKVKGRINAASGNVNSFQKIMNGKTFASTDEFVALITESGYYEEVN